MDAPVSQKPRSGFIVFTVICVAFLSGYNEMSFLGTGPATSVPGTTKIRRQQETTADHAAAAVGKNGTWIGNTWIPPSGWRLYSPAELRTFYTNTNTLWLGDSTARRAALTLFAILNSTTSNADFQELEDPTVLNVNKIKETEPCNDIIHHTKSDICRRLTDGSRYVFQRRLCSDHILSFVQDELENRSNYTNGTDLVIISMGLWDQHQPEKCGGTRHTEASISIAVARIGELLVKLFQMRPRLTVVWRTSGWKHTGKQSLVDSFNEAIRLLSGSAQHPQLILVDSAKEIQARSFGKARIHGDSPEHYGLEARLVMLQMMTNLLQNNHPRGD